MMKKLNFLFLFLLFQSSIVFSQNAQKAKQLLDQVSAKLKSYENVQINFSYAHVDLKKNIDMDKKGDLTVKGNQYVLNFMGVTKIFDGKKSYTINSEDEEITVSKSQDPENDEFSPARMLTFFNKGFTYSWDITQPIKGRKIQYIKLIPIDKKDYRKEVFVGVDTQSKQLYNLIEVSKDGSKVTLTVNSFKPNQPISKNHFTFVQSKYPNYYINNLD